MNKNKGTLLVFLAAVLFSMGGLLVKIIPWTAMPLNGARCLVSVCVLAVYMKLTRHKLVINKAVLLGAVCSFGTNILYTIANKMTTAANTIILQFTAPVFIILFMWLFFNEKPRKLDVIACFFVFSGIVCFFIDGISAGNIVGNVLALMSGVTYAGVFMMNTFRGSDPLSSVIIGHSLGAVIGLPFIATQTEFSLPIIGGILILGMFQMALAYIFLTNGLLSTPPVTASLVTGIEPILNPVLVAVFYHEYIGAVSVAGAVIVVGTILIYDVIKGRTDPEQGDNYE